jgi:Protein of unknown function (DUF3307)
MIEMFFRLLVGHAIADFPLQSEDIAKGKNRHAIPKSYDPKLHGPLMAVWPYYLTSHALIHGGMVYIATGSYIAGLCETTAHWIIDFFKCEKWYGVHADQAFHIACKVVWLAWFTHT